MAGHEILVLGIGVRVPARQQSLFTKPRRDNDQKGQTTVAHLA